MLGIATKPYLNTTARSDNDAGVPFPTHRRRHRIEGPQPRYFAVGVPPSALSRRLEGFTNPALAITPSIWIDSVPS